MVILDSIKDAKLVELITSGAIGVLPSDTLYGIMCSADNEQAAKRLYDLKQRQQDPGTIVAASVDQLVNLGLKARYLKAVEQFWPGPVSVIIPVGQELEFLHLGKHSLAVRVPSPAELSGLLEQTGPLLTTSANISGQPPANNISEAQAYFGDTVDFYVDGGDLSGHQPSTIIRIIDDAIDVVRQGAVKINEKGEIE